MAQLPGVHREFVRAAMAAPFLERGEEHELALRWRDFREQRALDQLSASHMRLVIALASRFRHYGLPIADVIQEGHVGLLEAAARFDPDREVRFSTYATWWIRAAIQDYILRNWSIVRGGTSSAQKALFFNLRRLRAQMANTAVEKNVLYDRIGKAVGVSSADVELMSARFSGPGHFAQRADRRRRRSPIRRSVAISSSTTGRCRTRPSAMTSIRSAVTPC